ncbi:electron transfer flavoprotein subunit alpha/FixB family protein [Corynebacterium mayonis]|uniref:electron transfer flavoprotein subunit alpha/FixB family protein n=1 Tax=Corynebacterium mayonis TaxID=3062461 RepID=UPI0031403DD2
MTSQPVLVVLDPALDNAAELIGAASVVGDPVVVTTSGAEMIEAPRVLVAKEASLVDATEAAFKKLQPAAVVLPHSVRGRDVAARLSVRTRCALLTDVVGIRRDAEGIVTDHSNFGGAFNSVAAATHSAPIITVRLGAVETRASFAAPVVEYLEVDTAGRREATVVSTEPIVRTSTRPELVSAKRVVAGGVSLGDEDSFEELVGGLADALNAAVGATRSAVDEGQAPYEAQIGQTGVLVSPKLYVGVGISGAIQHLVGMQTSETVVAINNDPDAPIFEIADFGIVGDIFDIVPQLIDEINARK